jgi:UDP-3-O-[3-hydroxymyristoyl] glucosamine N-acyltransferase
VVVIEDDVEIGANSCVDRAKAGQTVIRRGTKIDNLVQVAHNCETGPSCILTGQVGLSGSVRLGAGVFLGGQSGVSHGIEVCGGARINAQAAVFSDIKTPGPYSGTPARPHVEHYRALAAARRLPELLTRVKELTRRVAELEAAMHDRRAG